jgi:phospho-N-acetylmuramoyl-pentapeptide-transferase
VLPWAAERLSAWWGPLRLLASHLVLIGAGASFGALATALLLPRLWRRLPRDRGRAHAVAAASARGKPAGAGIIFVPIYLAACLLAVPLEAWVLGLLACVCLAAVEGYLDDRAPGGWGELSLGMADLGISALAAASLYGFHPAVIWLPVRAASLAVPAWVALPAATGLIWLSINATNCTDGVDGLSGSLSAIALAALGVILYAVVGHREIAQYLIVPHDPRGAAAAMLAFLMVGCLAGYLWHNARPSAVLMGDAGSRPLGLLLGSLGLATGNPVILFVVGGVIFANGATGLPKLAFARFLRIGIFPRVRYPLHDHARMNKGWSDGQVLMRFVIVQLVLMPLLLLLLFKVR